MMTKRIEETLIQLKQNKVIICIATGRPLKNVPHFPNVEFDIFLISATRIGANGKVQDLIDYFAISDQLVEVAEDFDDLRKEDIYQIMMGCSKEEYDQVLDNVDGAKITAWWPRAVDIIPSNGGKGTGVEKVLEYYQLKKEEAIAFGDGTNDIEMLQAVGTGVAMGNATNDVKDIADDICESVAEDGIYFYCKKYHLI